MGPGGPDTAGPAVGCVNIEDTGGSTLATGTAETPDPSRTTGAVRAHHAAPATQGASRSGRATGTTRAAVAADSPCPACPACPA